MKRISLQLVLILAIILAALLGAFGYSPFSIWSTGNPNTAEIDSCYSSSYCVDSRYYTGAFNGCDGGNPNYEWNRLWWESEDRTTRVADTGWIKGRANLGAPPWGSGPGTGNYYRLFCSSTTQAWCDSKIECTEWTKYGNTEARTCTNQCGERKMESRTIEAIPEEPIEIIPETPEEIIPSLESMKEIPSELIIISAVLVGIMAFLGYIIMKKARK